MRPSCSPRHGNTRALLLGVSLLVMSGCHGETPNTVHAVSQGDWVSSRAIPDARAPQAWQQLVTGLTLLGYRAAQLEQLLLAGDQPVLMAAWASMAARIAQAAALPLSVTPLTTADQRATLAAVQGRLFSGSSPVLL